MAAVQNPVIRGFNPDPSICRVGKDYYLVTSTFEFFPGISIYHSRNLADWKLIDHCLKTPRQLDLQGCRPSGGLYAPTIRYHDGMFFITCTNVTGKGNFIVHAQDIHGPWQGPFWIDQGGIDPSMLFDEGKCYLASSDQWEGRSCILQCEIDMLTGEKLAPSRPICYGSDGKYPEAPHLYHIGKWYYLMLAEGGTEYGHMVTFFRGEHPYGPFEPCPAQPILSQRGAAAQGQTFQCAGHGDLVQDERGAWWMVSLGIRALPNVLLHNLGRETFLSRVAWGRDGWPTVNGCGRLVSDILVDGTAGGKTCDFQDDFSAQGFDVEYLFLRNPHDACYRRGKKVLRLCASDDMDSLGSPTMACVRQKEWVFKMRVTVAASDGSCAGLSAYYCNNQHYDIAVERTADKQQVVLRKRVYDTVSVEAREAAGGPVELIVEADQHFYRFSYVCGGLQTALGEGCVAGLCTECSSTMTFTGVMLGMFAQRGEADFTSFAVQYSC